jgi:antitoxin ParD1/3/4
VNIDSVWQTLPSLSKGDQAMATMNISLPEQMKSWAEAQSEDGKYSNSSDFVRDLIRREQGRREKIAHVQAMVDEGIASGISDRSVDDILREVQAEMADETQSV